MWTHLLIAFSSTEINKDDIATMRDLLQLTDTEVSAVGSLAPGTGLWKVGQRSFIVQHVISEAERWVVDTEPRERQT